jgi:hypothetical protein
LYPVTNEHAAVEIARDWNVPNSGVGYVTRFEVDATFMARYETRVVGVRTAVRPFERPLPVNATGGSRPLCAGRNYAQGADANGAGHYGGELWESAKSVHSFCVCGNRMSVSGALYRTISQSDAGSLAGAS